MQRGREPGGLLAGAGGAGPATPAPPGHTPSTSGCSRHAGLSLSNAWMLSGRSSAPVQCRRRASTNMCAPKRCASSQHARRTSNGGDANSGTPSGRYLRRAVASRRLRYPRLTKVRRKGGATPAALPMCATKASVSRLPKWPSTSTARKDSRASSLVWAPEGGRTSPVSTRWHAPTASYASPERLRTSGSPAAFQPTTTLSPRRPPPKRWSTVEKGGNGSHTAFMAFLHKLLDGSSASSAGAACCEATAGAWRPRASIMRCWWACRTRPPACMARAIATS
mmetsp:Transcript_62289/g.175604  ORF Transcript_62289/g.175604 Transcript_62289/m.175604 type:complete len:280 (-) Transcript_62289:1077-1916(-)